MNKTQIGDISEQKFILHCLVNNVPVCKPIGNNLPYDFVVDYNNTLLKIQVKTAYKATAQDSWTFNTRSTSKNYSEVTDHNYSGLIDYFAVVNPECDKVVFVPIDKAAKGSMAIYYGENPKSNQKWYKDFLLF